MYLRRGATLTYLLLFEPGVLIKIKTEWLAGRLSRRGNEKPTRHSGGRNIIRVKLLARWKEGVISGYCLLCTIFTGVNGEIKILLG